jgi:hypothetical protein
MDQMQNKRASFTGMRGKKAAFHGMRGKKANDDSIDTRDIDSPVS